MRLLLCPILIVASLCLPRCRFPDAPAAGQMQRNTQAPIRSNKSAGKVVAITFDDGPHGALTPRLLDILRDRQVKATFFVVGDRCTRFAPILRRMLAEGHEIGNHTWTHPRAPHHLEPAAFQQEVRRTHDTLVALTGAHPTCYRPPGGNSTPAQRQWLAEEYGYPVVLWSVDPKYYQVLNKDRITQHFDL
jgi:peptidoglycan-N-acetylglucosamine deacetylase